MDSISRPEFAQIFDRVWGQIKLKGRPSALAIELELIEVRDRCKAKSKTSPTGTERAKYSRRAEWMDKLIEHDFGGRVMFEAHRNPHGLIALTLKYGRQEALQRIKAQSKAAIRSRLAYGTIPRVARTLEVPGVPRRPEFRRIPTHRRRRWRQWL